MDRMVFFNIAWMKEYKGATPNDKPVHGGEHIDKNKWGDEVYNFQPYRRKMYGFVEAGWKPKPRCIRIAEHFGASEREQSVPGVLIVWVATHCHGGGRLVVGWYKNATIYRKRQKPPEGSSRKRPEGEDALYFGEDALYFAEADEHNCYCIPPDRRKFPIPSGKGGFGRKNIWYAESEIGTKTKAEVLQYIREWENLLGVR